MDECDCNKYYVCKEKVNGGYRVHDMQCPQCQHFKPDIQACVKVSDACDNPNPGWTPSVVQYDGGE